MSRVPNLSRKMTKTSLPAWTDQADEVGEEAARVGGAAVGGGDVGGVATVAEAMAGTQ